MLLTCHPSLSIFLKSKWSAFFSKLASNSSSSNKSSNRHSATTATATATATTTTTMPPRTGPHSLFCCHTVHQRRKNSNASDVMSLLFRRRGSNASSSSSDEKFLSATEIQKTLDHIQELYIFALDELNFAFDSCGSLYYEGDRITAREAIDNFTNAFMQVLHQIPDLHRRSQLQVDITPKLARLQERYNALPPLP